MINQVQTKHFYRFVEYTLRIKKINLPHERIKKIVLDKYQAETKDELLAKKVANTYTYLLDNAKQIISKEVIKEAYFLLTAKKLNEKIIENILLVYYQNYEESSYYLASLIHLEIIKKVHERKIEFAFLISNLIMNKKKKTTLIPYQYINKHYKKAIKEKNKILLMSIFKDIEEKENKIKTNTQVSVEEIIKCIKKNKYNLQKTYKVKHLYLYGSQVKGIRHKNSDIDFLVIFDEELINLDIQIIKRKVIKYLGLRLNAKVDIISFHHALTKLDIKEMENIIKII